MENAIAIGLVALVGLVLGFLVGGFYQTPVEIPACPAAVQCPDVTCESLVVEKIVYEQCSDLDDLEDDMDALEDELGVNIHTFRTSKTCNDYLEDLGSRWDDRTIQGHAPTELGCVIYYTN